MLKETTNTYDNFKMPIAINKLIISKLRNEDNLLKRLS